MNEIATAYVRIRPNTTGFKAEAEQGIKGAFRSIGKLTVAAIGITGLAEATKAVVTAAAKQQVAIAQVQKSVENANASWILHGKTVKEVLEANARATGFTVADQAAAFTKAVAATQNTAKAYRILVDAEDLARTSGRSLSAATLVVQRAFQGSSQSLRRYGIVIAPITAAQDALKKSHEGLIIQGAKFTKTQQILYRDSLALAKARDKLASSTNVLNIIEQKFGGQAAVYAQSTAGQLARLKETINQFEVGIGEQLLPTINVALSGLRGWVNGLRTSVAVHNSVSSVVVGLRASFTAVVAVLKVVSPLISTVAKAGASLVQSLGGTGLLSIAIGYKAIATAVGLYSIAQSKLAAIMLAGTAASSSSAAAAKNLTTSIAELNAEGAQSAIVWDENTASISAYSAAQVEALAAQRAAAASTEVQTAALLAQAAAYKVTTVAAFGGGQMIRNAQGQFVGTTRQIDEMSRSTFKFGNVARGVFNSLGGWMTVAQIGAAALAFGIYKIVTADTAWESANRRVTASLDLLARQRQKLADLTKQRQAVAEVLPQDREALANARLAVERAKENLQTVAASKSSLEYRQAKQNVRDALLNELTALRQLNRDKAESDRLDKAIPFKQGQIQQSVTNTAKRYAQLAEQITFVSQTTLRQVAGAQSLSQDDPKLLAIRLAANRHAAEVFRKQLIDDANKTKNVLDRHNERVLADLIYQTGRVPKPATIKFILSNTDLKKGLGELQNELGVATAKGNKKANQGGHEMGAAFGHSVAQGIIGSTGAVERAVDALATAMTKRAQKPGQSVTVVVNPPTAAGKATGGVIGGSGSGDVVPAMLTPGEIVLNRKQQSRLATHLGMPDRGPHDLFRVAQGFQDGGVVNPRLNVLPANLQPHTGSWLSHLIGRLVHGSMSPEEYRDWQRKTGVKPQNSVEKGLSAALGMDPLHPLRFLSRLHGQAGRISHPDDKLRERDIVAALLSGSFGFPQMRVVSGKDVQFVWKGEGQLRAEGPGMVKAEHLTRAVTAIKDGQNVGRLSIVQKGKKWEVLNAVVHPEYKRQGIGEAMFREAELMVGLGNLRHSKLLTDEGKAFARAVRPIPKPPVLGARGELNVEDFTSKGGIYKPEAAKGIVERVRQQTKPAGITRNVKLESLNEGEQFLFDTNAGQMRFEVVDRGEGHKFATVKPINRLAKSFYGEGGRFPSPSGDGTTIFARTAPVRAIFPRLRTRLPDTNLSTMNAATAVFYKRLWDASSGGHSRNNLEAVKRMLDLDKEFKALLKGQHFQGGGVVRNPFLRAKILSQYHDGGKLGDFLHWLLYGRKDAPPNAGILGVGHDLKTTFDPRTREGLINLAGIFYPGSGRLRAVPMEKAFQVKAAAPGGIRPQFAKALQRTIAAVGKLHSFPTSAAGRSRVHPVEPWLGPKREPYAEFDLIEGIRLKDMAAAQYSLTHEIGHALDAELMTGLGMRIDRGGAFRGASESIEFIARQIAQGVVPKSIKPKLAAVENLMEAISSSRRMTKIHDLAKQPEWTWPRGDHDFKYLAKPEESFARAYAQWVATRSRSRTLKGELVKAGRQNAYEVWTKEDFAPIAKRFDELFRTFKLAKFNRGGIVGDSVPAMLTPGEMVLNRKQQQNMAGMLGFASGGVTPQSLFKLVSGKGFQEGGVVGPNFGLGGGAEVATLSQLAAVTQAKINKLLSFDAGKLHDASQNISDTMSTLADTIRQSIKTIQDTIISAKQNLNTIGQSFATDLSNFVAKLGSEGGTKATGPVAARLKVLDAQIATGKATPELIRAAQALNNQLAAQQTIKAAKAGGSESEIIARKIADATDLANKGAITPKQFEARINAITKSVGFTFTKEQKLLGVAAADQARADRQALTDQLKAIIASPKFGGSGLAPQIVRPLEQIKIEQKNISDVAKGQRDQLIQEQQNAVAELKKHTKLLKDQKAAAAAKQGPLDWVKILRSFGATDQELIALGLIRAKVATQFNHR